MHEYMDGLVQDCSKSISEAVELLQSSAKPLLYNIIDISYYIVDGHVCLEVYLPICVSGCHWRVYQALVSVPVQRHQSSGALLHTNEGYCTVRRPFVSQTRPAQPLQALTTPSHGSFQVFLKVWTPKVGATTDEPLLECHWFCHMIIIIIIWNNSMIYHGNLSICLELIELITTGDTLSIPHSSTMNENMSLSSCLRLSLAEITCHMFVNT